MWRDPYQAFFLENHSSLQHIRYFGVLPRDDVKLWWAPENERIEYNCHLESITMTVLKKLKRDQLKGFIIDEANLIPKTVTRCLQNEQRSIESIFECPSKKSRAFVRQESAPTSEGFLERLLHEKTAVKDISLPFPSTAELFELHHTLLLHAAHLRSLRLIRLNIKDSYFRSSLDVTDPLVNPLLNIASRPDLKERKLIALREVYIRGGGGDLSTLATLACSGIIDYSVLTSLALEGCSKWTKIWRELSSCNLRLRSLALQDSYPIELTNQILMSFKGLTTLVLQFPHDPESVKPGILNHAGSLEKLYWRSIIQNDVGLCHPRRVRGKILERKDLNLEGFVKLTELGLCVVEEDLARLHPPPSLKLLWVLPLPSLRKKFLRHPSPQEIERIVNGLYRLGDAPSIPFLAIGPRTEGYFPAIYRYGRLHQNLQDIWYERVDNQELKEYYPYLTQGMVGKDVDWLPWELGCALA
ncbi:hypothetical protein ABW19_dt0209548 [Dactylella cylindrospora]|nr:hypothetical protein ABW19_dt0209548 [Dactylella cylindrospora]